MPIVSNITCPFGNPDTPGHTLPTGPDHIPHLSDRHEHLSSSDPLASVASVASVAVAAQVASVAVAAVLVFLPPS